MIVVINEGYRAKYACSHYDNIGLDSQCFGLGWCGLVMVWAVVQGVSVTPVLPDGSGGEVTRSTATLIEVNGVDAGLWLLEPVLLTIIGLLAVHLFNPGS